MCPPPVFLSRLQYLAAGMCVMVAAGSKYMDMHVDLMSWNSTQHTITVLSVPVKASMTRLHFCVCFQAYFLNICLVDYLHHHINPPSSKTVLGGHWWNVIYALLCRIHTHTVQTVLHLIWQSFPQYVYVWFSEWTYGQKTCVWLSSNCEIYKSQTILKLCAVEWFQISAL